MWLPIVDSASDGHLQSLTLWSGYGGYVIEDEGNRTTSSCTSCGHHLFQTNRDIDRALMVNR